MTEQDQAEFEAFMQPGKYPTAKEIWLAARRNTLKMPPTHVIRGEDDVVTIEWHDGGDIQTIEVGHEGWIHTVFKDGQVESCADYEWNKTEPTRRNTVSREKVEALVEAVGDLDSTDKLKCLDPPVVISVQRSCQCKNCKACRVVELATQLRDELK